MASSSSLQVPSSAEAVLHQSAQPNVKVGIDDCIRGDVLLKTQRGHVRADAVRASDSFEQPDGSLASITAIRETRITAGVSSRDRRLFSDASGKVVVTALHAVTASAGAPLVPACEHPNMLEILDVDDASLPPVIVFHFQTTESAALIGVADSSFWLESLHP